MRDTGVAGGIASCAGAGRPLSPLGFVLVEILVVALIVGILAAVAIPTYTSYIRTQKRGVANGIAQSAAAAANIYFRRTGNDPPDSASLKLFLTDPARYTVRISSPYIVVTDVSRPIPDTVQAMVKFR